jgi:polyferredoxin
MITKDVATVKSLAIAESEPTVVINSNHVGAYLMRKSGPASVLQVKKIAPSLRRKKINFEAEPLWYRRLSWRLREDSQFLRSTIQFAFLLLCVWIGIEFYLFVQWGTSNGASAYPGRPPGVEGFLPISALISLKYWLQTGIINQIHPASVFILLAIIAVSVVVKKAFCSWLCPIGTLSESLWLLGQKLFGRNLAVAGWVDYPLRALKYLLLLFFVYSIAHMDVLSLKNFIESPYNKVADIKMYLFFANISSFALWTILVFTALSVIIKNFWCRYGCPYGALLGIIGFLSPLKITRNKSTCIDCELCSRVCPANIRVHTTGRVWSDECMSCLACVEVCPVKQTLEMRTRTNREPIPSWIFGLLVVGVFTGITGLAMVMGHWQNRIMPTEYQRRFQQIDSPVYQHFRGQVAPYGPNE